MFKYFIISILLIAAIAGLYLGSYLPLRKAGLFVTASVAAAQAKSLEEFVGPFDQVINYYSPVGQNETVRFFGNRVTEILRQKPPEEVARVLVDYETKQMNSISESRGLNYVQSVLILGDMSKIMWLNYKKPADFEKAVSYYEGGLKLSPNRPQYLYGLLELYKSNNQSEKVKEISDQIFTNWPDAGKLKAE